MKENVLLVNMGDTETEVEAIRQSLEVFGYKTLKLSIGRPNDFIGVLNGCDYFNYKYLIISCHGIEENNIAKIIMPKLHESVYLNDEPKENFGSDQIKKYNKLTNKIIISTGCLTGNSELADSFAINKNIYIAPNGYPEGTSALMFVINLFYQLQKTNDIKTSYELSKSIDNETKIFDMFVD